MNNNNNTVSCVNYNPRPEWERWNGSHKCPKCGSDDIEYNTQLVLTSYPPQSQLRCKSCGHIFSSGYKSDLIDHDALNKVYDEVKKSFGIPEIRDPLPGEAPYIGDWPSSPKITDPLPNYPELDRGNMNYGWICPKCGRVLAPHVSSCPNCSPATTINITY